MRDKFLKDLVKNYSNNKIFMPNEIFKQLIECEWIHPDARSPHIAFAYTYYYLICVLYRYCLYELEGGGYLTRKQIKVILGYSKDNKTLDYLIKEHGVLDKLELM
jgi:hypothetical protein